MEEVSEALKARVRERLLAYIHPNVAVTGAQRDALDAAVAYQAAFEAENGDYVDAARRGVQRLSVGDYSESYFSVPTGGAGICAEARAALFNAGLLRRGLPCARRI